MFLHWQKYRKKKNLLHFHFARAQCLRHVFFSLYDDLNDGYKAAFRFIQLANTHRHIHIRTSHKNLFVNKTIIAARRDENDTTAHKYCYGEHMDMCIFVAGKI